MPESINSKIREQYDHDDSGGSLDTNQGDFLDSQSASGTSNNTKWRNWAEGTGTSLNTRLFHKHGGSGSFNTRWKNWIAFGSTHSFNFDGSNDYLEIENGDIPGGDESRTISAWINADVLSGDQGLVFTGTFNTNQQFTLAFLSSNANKLSVWGYSNDFTGTTTLSTGTWYHIVAVYDSSASNLKTYINGTVDINTTVSTNFNTTFGKTIIGARDGGGYFNGKIDEVAVWDVALSSSDITSVYNNGKIVDLSKSASYGTDRTANLKLWLRCGDKVEPETSIARSDFYTDFDGTNDYVDCGSDSSVDDIWTGGATFTAWINPRTVGESGFGFIGVKRDTNIGWYLATTDVSGSTCDIRFRVQGVAGAWNTTNREITFNEWYHIAVSYDSDSTSNNPIFYINGESVAITESTTPTTSYNSDASIDLKIGSDAGSFTFDGSISNVGIHQTILDAQTISQMAKSRFTPMRDNRFSVVDFDGSGDYISTNADSTLADATYTFWARSTQTGANKGVFGHGGQDRGAFHFNFSSLVYK